MIGYREGDSEQPVMINDKADALQIYLDVHMTRNASKLIGEDRKCLAELSCEGFDCSIRIYPETKAFDMKLGSYRLSSPSGLLAEVGFISYSSVFRKLSNCFEIRLKLFFICMQSATPSDSLVGAFCYKPFDINVDWRMVAKASPCYITVCCLLEIPYHY